MRIVSISVVAVLLAWSAAAPIAGAESLGSKVVAFCEKHTGQQVGRGECADLANEALHSAGARGRKGDSPGKGDYAWGKLVVTFESGEKGPKITGEPSEIRPGDILQFRDAKLQGKRKHGHYTATANHHTAVVYGVKDEGQTLEVYQQNAGGKKTVSQTSLHLGDLKEGWVRVYQPVPSKSKK